MVICVCVDVRLGRWIEGQARPFSQASTASIQNTHSYKHKTKTQQQEDRRAIEAALFGGELLGVTATCALELGMCLFNLFVYMCVRYLYEKPSPPRRAAP